jgi:hypothetical protein
LAIANRFFARITLLGYQADKIAFPEFCRKLSQIDPKANWYRSGNVGQNTARYIRGQAMPEDGEFFFGDDGYLYV